jgi:hypothetical protein
LSGIIQPCSLGVSRRCERQPPARGK